MRWLAVFLALALPIEPVQAGKSETGQSWTRTVRFSDSETRATRFGKLTFLGGLEWGSSRADFGGFSGMLLDGDILTVLTDKGHWARTRLVFNPKGGLAAVEGLEIWRLYGADGGFLQRPYSDAEAITRDGDDLLIAFEGKHRVSRFAGLWGREQTVPGLPDLSELGNNKGLESLLKLPDGRLVMIAEEPPTGRDHTGWIIQDGVPEEFTIRRAARYSPPDIALGPDGKPLYLLERRYSLIGGPGMRIRQFPVSELKPGAVIEGDALIDLGAGYAVDNMEAIAARAGRSGTELLVLSDDNFSFRQRTLLLHFRINEE
jgi:hypothetical protein